MALGKSTVCQSSSMINSGSKRSEGESAGSGLNSVEAKFSQVASVGLGSSGPLVGVSASLITLIQKVRNPQSRLSTAFSAIVGSNHTTLLKQDRFRSQFTLHTAIDRLT